MVNIKSRADDKTTCLGVKSIQTSYDTWREGFREWLSLQEDFTPCSGLISSWQMNLFFYKRFPIIRWIWCMQSFKDLKKTVADSALTNMKMFSNIKIGGIFCRTMKKNQYFLLRKKISAMIRSTKRYDWFHFLNQLVNNIF